MTTAEFLLARKLGNGGGGDITVESLNVNENGTYTAPSGKAYSPVVVNLPLDEKTITANGEYLASADNLEGYSKVTVNVAGFTKKAMPTGAIASFNDGTANPLTKLKIAINPVQEGSGDPSPSNPRPISGWSSVGVVVNGKNFFDTSIYDVESQSDYYIINNGSITIIASHSGAWTNIPIIPLKAGTYTISLNGSNSSSRYRTSDDNYISEKYINPPSYTETFTLAEDGGIKFKFNVGGTYPVTITPQIELGSPATTYTSYVGTTVPISWQTEAGEVFGGELDVTSGVLKVDKIGVKVKDLSWTYQSSGLRFFTSDLASVIKTPADNTQALDGFICEVLKNSSANQVFTSEGCIGVASSGNVFLRNTAWDEEQELISAIGDNYIVYPIITPTTIQLTPTAISSLLGTNNIWADTGDILEGEYFKEL